MAPIPPPPIDLDYDLGHLPRGSYFAAFRMNGFFYDVEQFRIDDAGFEAEVDLSVDVGDEVIVKAVVDIDDPYVIVTNPGTPDHPGLHDQDQRHRRTRGVHRPAERRPAGVRHTTSARSNRATTTSSTRSTSVPEACTRFLVPDPPDPPLPNISHIRIAQGDVSWFSEVGVILLPGQEVTDWGVVRRGRQRLPRQHHRRVGHLPAATGAAARPAARRSQPAGGHRLRCHQRTLDLGRPGAPGHAHLRARRARPRPLRVLRPLPRPDGRPQVVRRSRRTARVELSAANITEATDEYRFGISYQDPDGLDHQSIMNAEVAVVGPDGYREIARLLSYASTDDDPEHRRLGPLRGERPGRRLGLPRQRTLLRGGGSRGDP